MSTADLLWAVLFGSIGAGYLLYGWRQRAVLPLACGAALLVLPYLASNLFGLLPAGLALAVAPWWRRR